MACGTKENLDLFLVIRGRQKRRPDSNSLKWDARGCMVTNNVIGLFHQSVFVNVFSAR